ncbi:trypsin-like serine protease [Nonomuraea sp. NPDC050786]|uniref:trypsin-like serine peptidase n=1 Tax=Nonomuraea sp. NPDC050786 TaxID=3154840 RepID=UPI0034060CC7
MTLSTPLLAAAPLLAGLIGPALLGGAPGRQQADQPAHRAVRTEIVEHVAARTAADQRRVLDYWTPERMAKALPIHLLDLVTDGAGLLSGVTGRTGLRAAPDVSGGRVAPDPLNLTPSRRHQAAGRPQTNTVGSRWITGGAVARTTGRVFMTVAGTDFVCSASTVKSANRDVVVTAGHCVKDGTGEWAANWTFVPGYETAGLQPYGQYAARRMFVAGPWSRSGDDNYDVGMVALATSGGRHVADVVGAQEIAFNTARGGQAFGFGYPADPPYDGDHLVYCAGRLKDDPYGQSRDQGLACDMTAGSSGGPWLTAFDPGSGKGTITSLSSFKYSDDHRTMYGPYFGDTVKALFNTTEHA